MSVIVGYHGTSSDVAELLVGGGQQFEASQNLGDWLGGGIYFWQDAPERAFHWAKMKCALVGKTPAVVRTKIDISDGLDLFDLSAFESLRLVYKKFSEFEIASAVTYDQRSLKIEDGKIHLSSESLQAGGAVNYRDRAFFDFAIPLIENLKRSTVKCIRSPFIYGSALHPSSYLFDWAHVQICVRDKEAFSEPPERVL